MCDRCNGLEAQLTIYSIIIDELRANPRAEIEAAQAEARRWQQEYKSLQAERDYCSVEHVEELEAQLNAVKAAARHYLERTYWRGNGERLAALVGYQHPCEPDAKADGRAWED